MHTCPKCGHSHPCEYRQAAGAAQHGKPATPAQRAARAKSLAKARAALAARRATPAPR